MKTTGFILLCLSILFAILDAIFGIRCNYQYDKTIGSYWELADKSSTITQKAKHIDVFVATLENSGLQGKHNAIMFTTPDNSFDLNLEALKTLQTRLHEIETMDVKSFEYQTAIQQITAQEQGEAAPMLNTFRGIWIKTHYFMLWNWIAWTQGIILFIMFIVGLVLLSEDDF